MRGRRNKRYSKKVMFPFGAIMLPVIGLIALGLLIVGIKMFFWPGGTNEDYVFSSIVDSPPTANQVHSDQKDTMKVDKGSLFISKKGEPVSEKIIAVPVVGDNGRVVDVPSVMEITSTQEPVKKTSEKQDGRVNVERDNNNKLVKNRQCWGVQIGSFIKKEAAEKLARQVKDKGFHVQVVDIQISGNRYHRVIVQGGKDKTEASKVARILKSKGFPVFIMSVD